MGIEVVFTGIELSKRKVENKGMQHYINSERFNDVLYKNEYERFNDLNFKISFRRPSSEFTQPLINISETFSNKDSMFPDSTCYVLTKENVLQLREEGFNEDRFKGSKEERFYHMLMSHLCELEDYEDKFREFYLIMEIYY